MKKHGFGGGNTITGLKFERERDVASLVKSLKGYSVKDNIIYYEGKEVARSYKNIVCISTYRQMGLIGKNNFKKTFAR